MGSSRVDFDPAPANTSHLLLSSSSRRKSVTFFPPAGETATLSNDPGVVLNKGITLQQTQAPITLTYDLHGECVCREWYVIGSLGANPVAFIQVID